jgi:hypothetical protein
MTKVSFYTMFDGRVIKANEPEWKSFNKFSKKRNIVKLTVYDAEGITNYSQDRRGKVFARRECA